MSINLEWHKAGDFEFIITLKRLSLLCALAYSKNLHRATIFTIFSY